MKICAASVSYRGTGRHELEYILEDAPKHGYEYLEIQEFSRQMQQEKVDVSEILDEMTALGLKAAAVYGPGFGGVNAQQAQQSMTDTHKMMEIAKAFDCDKVVSTGRGGKPDNGIPYIIEVMNAIAEDAQANNIKICLEPHYRNIIETLEDYQEIFAEVTHPNIGICLDTGHFYMSGVDTIKLIHTFPKRISHAHIKDHIGHKSVAYGKGEVDNKSVINALEEIGYQGFLSVELEVEDKQNVSRYMGGAKKYLEELK